MLFRSVQVLIPRSALFRRLSAQLSSSSPASSVLFLQGSTFLNSSIRPRDYCGVLLARAHQRQPAPASAPPLRFPLPGKAVLFPTLPAPNQFTPQRPAAPSKSGVRKNHPTGCRNQLCAFLWREMSLSLRTQFWQGICGCSEVQAPSYQQIGRAHV